MAGNRHAVGDHDAIAELAVVTDVGVGHQQVATADAGALAVPCADDDAVVDTVAVAVTVRVDVEVSEMRALVVTVAVAGEDALSDPVSDAAADAGILAV